MLGDDTSQKRMDDGDIYPIWSLCNFQTTKQIFYTAHVRNPPHDMEWTLLSHRPPLKLVPPFLLMILMWSASGVFSFLHRSEKKSPLEMRELSPALIAAFSYMVIFHPVGRSFSGGCMCVRNDSTPQKKNRRERRAWILMDPNIHRHSDQTPLPRRASGPILLIPR